jgi:hypothetical protein
MFAKSYANEFDQLSRLRFDTIGSPLFTMRFWIVKSSDESINSVNSLAFMYKLQVGDSVGSISKCLQSYSKELKS